MTHDVVTIFNEITNSSRLYVLYGFLGILHRCVYVQAIFYVHIYAELSRIRRQLLARTARYKFDSRASNNWELPKRTVCRPPIIFFRQANFVHTQAWRHKWESKRLLKRNRKALTYLIAAFPRQSSAIEKSFDSYNAVHCYMYTCHIF